MESQIRSALPDYKMMDYKVDYLNHSQFQKGNLIVLAKPVAGVSMCDFVLKVLAGNWDLRSVFLLMWR